jgi:MFS family permease
MTSTIVRSWRGVGRAAPRHRLGFWAVAYAFLALLSFSTAPSPLYVLYARRDHFSSLMITLIYAAYAVGVAGSLFFASHLSDVHGRRPHLLTAVALAVASGALFIAWPALPGLFAARILCGISVGLTVSTATAYLSESHRAQGAATSAARPQFTAAAANLGGLSLGALLTGLLAQYAGHPLVLPYVVLLGMLALAAVAVALSPETRDRQRPLPAYRPQRVSAPEGARAPFFAALTGVFLAYAGPAVFIGLAGTFLATAVHDTSLAMTGLTIFVVFTVGVVLLSVTGTWPARRLLATGAAAQIAGLALVVTAAWLPRPVPGRRGRRRRGRRDPVQGDAERPHRDLAPGAPGRGAGRVLPLRLPGPFPAGHRGRRRAPVHQPARHPAGLRDRGQRRDSGRPAAPGLDPPPPRPRLSFPTFAVRWCRVIRQQIKSVPVQRGASPGRPVARKREVWEVGRWRRRQQPRSRGGTC